MNRFLLTLIFITGIVSSALAQQHTFSVSDTTFLLDGKPFVVISGELHYTRVPREAWRQRMRMAKAMGLNTIGTYVFWNVQEPEKGKFDFSGNNDIAEFVRTAREEGLWVILRPSPYVCAEWEYGGYPYWLQNEKDLVVRSTNANYIALYREYIREVGKQLAPLQVGHGGNILMVQVENEYGSYAGDSTYLALNKDMFREAGFDGLLYTCDPAKDLSRGHLRGLLPAVNGIEDPAHIKSIVKEYHDGKGPFFVAEWYPAWFDWWGEPHHTVAAAKYAGQLDTLLANGISINMYMFHGGTTRGFMNGANNYDTSWFQPQISSYDYDAPLDEAGNATPKFMAFRKVIQAHLSYTLPDVPPARPAIRIPAITLTTQSFLFDHLPQPVPSPHPLSFEDMHQAYGYMLYRTTIEGKGRGWLKINGLRDYALIFLDGKRIGVLDRRHKQDSLQLDLPGKKQQLDILVENLGRVNFGPYLLKNRKGIIGNVEWRGADLTGWENYSLPFSNPISPTQTAQPRSTTAPILRSATFHLDTPGDTWLDMTHWGKGVVWINGHNLGRYWQVGPQQTLYVPAEWLKKGDNEVIVFEMLKPTQNKLEAIDHPILNVLQP